MDQTKAELNPTIIIAILAAFIGLILLLLLILYCIRRHKSNQFKPISSSNTTDNCIQKEKLVQDNNNVVINVPESPNEKPLSQESDDLEDQLSNYKFLGISLSEIPFIDDSKCSSYVDLTWYPYQPLTNKS